MTDKTASPPPAYFLSLSLENVRSFGEKQTISFARPDGRPAQWTIILGDNGVGKTTVLKALATMMPEFQPQSEAGAVGFISDLKYNWYFVRNSTHDDTHIDCTTITGLSISTQLNSEQGVLHETYLYRTGRANIKRDGILGGSYGGTKALMGLICYGYGAGRMTGNSALGDSSQAPYSCASLFDDRADLVNPEEWFLRMEYSSLKGDKQAAKSLEQVRQALLKVLPDITNIVIISEGHQQFVELETPYGWVRLRDMSLGYQTLVVWLTDFASKLFIRYPDSPNPLEMPAIVLIDEIDLHLHPSWQRKLLRFLSDIFINTQFIATAHSPLVVQAAGDMEGTNVVLLKREGDQTIVRQNPEDVRGWRIDQILTSTFFNLETARSVETEKKMTRQATLLNKAKLSAKERRELDALTLELEGAAMGSVGGEAEEAEILRELTARLNQSADQPPRP